MARVVVDVMLKPEILDPQGKAVHGALPRLGFEGVTGVVNAGTGLIDARPRRPASAAPVTDADSDCTYRPVAAAGSVTTTP